MDYNPKIIIQYWQTLKLPAAVAEWRFDEHRKWRFDFAFVDQRVAIEVQGGIWAVSHGRRCPVCKQTPTGRHTRGAALKKEWEKLNAAAGQGWRILYCEPRAIGTLKFSKEIERALCCEIW